MKKCTKEFPNTLRKTETSVKIDIGNLKTCLVILN